MNKEEMEANETLSAINNAWRNRNPEEMKKYLHPDIVMILPGFSGEIIGREKLIDGFKEFCTNAEVLEYSESDEQINVVGNCAVISFKFEMVYERTTYRDKSTGRDLWIFDRQDNKWIAVWRTMIDVNEVRLFEK
jgi:Domain of unknown function (DUF4440)